MHTYKILLNKGQAVLIDKDNEKYSIQDVITSKIEAQGLTKEDLARESGINRTALFRFLAGSQEISYNKLLAILAVLEVQVKV